MFSMSRFMRLTRAAAGTFSWKWNHSILFLPLMTRVVLAQAKRMWTSASSFMLCSLRTVNISTQRWLSSLSHSKIRCWGTMRLVRPIFRWQQVALGSYSSMFLKPQMQPGQSELEGALMMASMRCCCTSSEFFFQYLQTRGLSARWVATIWGVMPGMRLLPRNSSSQQQPSSIIIYMKWRVLY